MKKQKISLEIPNMIQALDTALKDYKLVLYARGDKLVMRDEKTKTEAELEVLGR